MKSFDPYQILGIEPEAPLEEIRRAFREKARRLHPDLGGRTEDFLELKRSYDWLCARKAPVCLQIVKDRPLGGDYLLTFLDVTVAEISLGATVTISVPDRPMRCPHCGGEGHDPAGRRKTCSLCGGSGRLSLRRSPTGEVVCPRCAGEGVVYLDSCPSCRGRGELPSEREMQIKIPLGARPGDLLYLPAGEEGPHIDVYFELQVHPTENLFFEEGRLVCLVQVPFWRAALGGRVKVETLEGMEELEIPPGLSHGTTLVLSSRGPYREDGSREDLWVKFEIFFPKKLPQEARKYLERLGEILEGGQP